MVKHVSRVKHTRDSIVEEIANLLASQLRNVGLHATSWSPASGLSPADLEFAVGFQHATMKLLASVRRNLEPRLARAALFDLNQIMKHQPGVYAILAGSFVGPQVRELCRDAGVGYFDLMGNVYLRFGNVLIDRSSDRRPASADRPLRTLFSWKASRIVRNLLSHPKDRFEVQQLATLCQVSIGLASKVKTRLVDQDYARHSRGGVQVVRPEALLRDWAGHYSYRSHPSLDCFGNDRVASLEQNFCEYATSRRLDYGLALFSGAARVAPMVPHVRGFAYVHSPSGGLAGVARELGWKPVPTGANFTLLEPRDPSVLWNRTPWSKTDQIVGDIQLFLDLATHPGRGAEAAEQVLDVRIRPTW